MDIDKMASLLSGYIKSLESFTIVDYFDGNYNHMGATISDAILQAGTKYETVVRPRIERILKIYPEAVTTSKFWRLLNEKGAKTVLKWNDEEKPTRVVRLTKFLLDEGIETEKELSVWIENEFNKTRLFMLRGIGPKTIDYIKILVGLQTVAVDQHLYGFLREAGIEVVGYDEARDILNYTADIIGTERVLLDHSIWQYMSKRKKRESKGLSCKNDD